jgi:autotransporter-associated beta strand protein
MKTRSNPFLRPARFVAALSLCLSAIPAHAGSLFWDGTTSTGDADGGNGTWNSALTNWDTLATGGADSVWTNANNDTAVFGGAAGTVLLGAPITVGGLQFDTAGYLVQTNTLTFGVSGNIVTNADATINSAIGAATDLTVTKTGSGTLTLGGNNTYAGNTTISNGTLKAGATTALSANSAYSVGAGAFLDLGGFSNTIKSLSTTTGTITNSTGNATLTISTMAATAQLFTGSLALKWNGVQGGNTVLSNINNAFSGGTTLGGVNARILLGNTTIGAGTPGALTSGYFGTGALTLGVTAADRAQILFTGAATINNAIVVNSALGNTDAAGTFRVDSSGNVFNGTLTASGANATFRNNGGTGSVTINGAISGASGLMLSASNGTGLTITLSNTGTANSYAGDTTISGLKETLTLGASNQIPNGASKGNLIVTDGTFKMGGFSETINGLSGTGTVDGVSGTPTLTVGDNDATGAANTFSGVIKNTSGTLALTKTGTGTLTLSGNNSYGGATTISGGMLLAGSATALSANSALSADTGTTLDLGGFNNTIKSLTTDTGTITDSSGAGLGGTLKIATTMPAGPSAQFFTGSMGLQLFGGSTGNTILSNTANDYSGGTILGNGSGAATTRLLLGAGTLGAGAPGAVTSGIFGTGAISIGAAATDKSQLYFSGGMTINHAIVVNTAAGTDQPGTFRVESGGSILAGAINANLADALFAKSNAGAGAINVTGAFSGASGLTVSTTGTASLNVTLTNTGTANSYAGNTTVSTAASALTLGAANQIPHGTGKGNLIVTSGAFKMGGFSETINGLSGAGIVDGTSGTPTLTVGDNDATGLDNTFDGVITDTAGTLALTKTGTGTLTLTNANSYSGDTTITRGTLSLGNGTTNTSLSDTAGVVIGTDVTAILNLNYTGTDTVATLTINGVGKPAGVYSSSDPSGRITGTGTLTVTSGGNPYTTWADTFLPGNDVSNPAGDNDNDGLSNQEEFAFGLSPISGSSVNPILVQLSKTAGTFTYQRRAATGLTYKILTSTTLAAESWTEDTVATAGQVATSSGSNETVVVTLTGAPLDAPKLFVRVSAE